GEENVEASRACSWRAFIREAPLDAIKQRICFERLAENTVDAGRVEGHRTFSRTGSYQWMGEQDLGVGPSVMLISRGSPSDGDCDAVSHERQSGGARCRRRRIDARCVGEPVRVCGA